MLTSQFEHEWNWYLGAHTHVVIIIIISSIIVVVVVVVVVIVLAIIGNHTKTSEDRSCACN